MDKIEPKTTNYNSRIVAVPLQEHSINVVAVGASAGGLEALQDFLSNLPQLDNTCVIIAQHLSPTHKSLLANLLSKETSLTVSEAYDGQVVQPNYVYITPPDKEITVVNKKINLKKPLLPLGPKPSIDVLFKSLARNTSCNAVAVILSGTGSDGAAGIKSLKENQSFVIVQDPLSAKYNGMPLAAIQTGMADIITTPNKIGKEIYHYILNPTKYENKPSANEQDTSSYSKILSILNQRTGTDFSPYKAATIGRRLEKRMSSLSINCLDDYLAFLRENPDEHDEMFKTILIGVTSFFRNQEAFEALEKHLLEIIDSKNENESIRIWVPGCSTGEEPYTISILLHRILKLKNKKNSVQVFATDIDGQAIQRARKGIYDKKSLEHLPYEIVEAYFLNNGASLELIKPVRSMVLFSEHDLNRHPPFLKLDLVSCRNLLIYFNTELQRQIIPIFHYALLSGGILFLGKSETVGHYTNLFESLDSKNKIFKRKIGDNISSLKIPAFSSVKNDGIKLQSNVVKKEFKIAELVKETLFNTFEHPYVVVNRDHDVLEVSGDVRLFMSLTTGSIQVNLIKMVNPEIQMDVRTILSKAIKDRSSFTSKIKKFDLYGDSHYVRITAKPLIYSATSEELFLVIFEKLEIEEFIATDTGKNLGDFENQRIQKLEYELASTKEHLQTYIEEIETTNEELQSLNEEMQSTNEEMQSSNEELETTNEELQSTNEEIQIAYGELKATLEELERKEFVVRDLQAKSQALLNNDLQGFILVDHAHRILNHNEKAVDILSQFRSKRFSPGDILIDFLPERRIDEFLDDFNKALMGETYNGEKSYVNLNGEDRWISITYNPVVFGDNQITGISIGLLDITDLKIALNSLSLSEKLVNSVFNIVSTGICITDENGRFVDVNRSYCAIHGYSKQELIGKSFDIVVPKSRRTRFEKLYQKLIEEEKLNSFTSQLLHKNGKYLTLSISADHLQLQDGKKYLVTSVNDITEQTKMRKLLEETQEIAQIGAWEYDVSSRSLSITPAVRKIFGIDDDFVIDLKSALEYFKAGKNSSQISKAFEKCLSGGISFDLELELVSDGYEEKWVRTIGKSEKNDGKTTRIYGSIQDISSVKDMEYQMASVSNNIPGAVFRYKLEKDGSDSISLLNEGARILWGLDPEAVMENSELVWDMIHPDDLPAIAESIQVSAKNLTRWLFEWRIIRSSGEVNWHQGTGNPKKTIDGGTVWDVIVLDITNVKSAEKLLENSNNELKKILESSMDVICTADSKGRFTSVSAASKSVFGYEPEELIGKHYINYVTPETRKQTEKFAYDIMSGVSVTYFENEYIRKDGTRVPLVWSAKWDWDTQLMFTIARNASELKKAQNQIVQNEKLLNDAQFLAKMGSWNFDFKSNKLTWTDSLYTVFGADKTTFKETYESFLDLVDREDKQLVRLTNVNAQKTGNPFNIEYKITTPSGEKRVIEEYGYSEKDASGSIIRLYGTAQNITEKKQAELKIKESHQRFIYATQATSDVIWDWDIYSGQVIWGENYDKVFGKIKNTSKNDVENVHARIHPEEIEELLIHAVKTIKSKETTWWFDHRYLKADGSYAHVSNKALIVRSKDGKATRVIGAMREITQKKQEEQHLKLLEKVITNTNDSIVITNAPANSENGPQILYVNEAFTRVTGYASEEVIGKFTSILEGPNTDKRDIQSLNQAIENGEHFEVTLLNYKKDGQVFWNNISMTPVTDTDGNYTNWISIQRDVTAQRNETYQNKFLDEISAMFSRESTLIATLECVLAHLADFGKFDLAEAWLVSPDKKKINLLGKIIGNDVSEKFYLENRIQTSFKIDEGIPGYVWKTGQIVVWDKVDSKLEFVRKADALRSGLNTVLGVPLLHNDALLGVLVFGSQGSAQDLLSFKDLFQNLETFLGGEVRRKQLEEELKNLFNTAPDIICISGLDGYFKKINPAACALLEYSEEELLSIPFMELIHPDDLEKTANRFLELPTLKNASYFENRYLTKSGKTIWLAWSTTPSAEEELIFSVAKDMTIQKTLQILLDSATNLAKIGGWEMEVGSNDQTWSTISMEIHEVNRTFEPTLKRFIEFYQGDAKTKVRSHLLNCLQHGIPFDFEFPILTAKGKEKWIRTIGNAEMRDGKPIRIYGSFQDIHDRKHAEKELVLAYEEKNTILESIGDAFYSVDKNWMVTYWNRKAEEFLGIKKEIILNRNLWDVVKEDHKITLFDKLLEIETFTENLNYEHYFERLKVWYSISAYPNTSGISVYFKDITQRKLYVEQIRESNERFEIVTQATNDAVWDYNVIDNEVYHGEGYRTLFGYPSGINRGGQKSWEEKIHPDDRQRLGAYFKGLFENSKIFDLYSEYKYKRADGTYAYVIDRGIILRDESGKVTRIIGATQDVTERKHYEESLKELNTKLEKHAKELALSNAELEQFAYVASHDLQEPLRMVTSFLTQLEKKYKPQLDEKAHQYIEFAVDGARRMRQIILDLLDYSRIGKHDDGLEEISLPKIVSEVLRLQGKLIEESGAQIFVGDLPTINTFKAPIVQIFQNIIGNSLKYRKKGTAPVISINAEESENEWLFSVGDNGIGIEKEYFERVFIIFQRLHSKHEYSGTGMGLAIVKKILENLGGQIWVRSETGIGSTFFFTIPKK